MTDWHQFVKTGKRDKRREAMRPVIERILVEANHPLKTWELAEAIALTGTQDAIHTAETAKLLAYDLLDIAPYFPQWCTRGEVLVLDRPGTKYHGKTQRPWVWARPDLRDALGEWEPQGLDDIALRKKINEARGLAVQDPDNKSWPPIIVRLRQEAIHRGLIQEYIEEKDEWDETS